jgi:hypothetical protein
MRRNTMSIVARLLGAAGLGLLLATGLAGCDQLPFGYTELRAIAENPARFEGKEVKVKGTVVDVMKLPILEIRVFVLKDATGQMSVQTSNAMPALNQNVVLKGRVESTAIIGGQSLGVRIMETQRL